MATTWLFRELALLYEDETGFEGLMEINSANNLYVPSSNVKEPPNRAMKINEDQRIIQRQRPLMTNSHENKGSGQVIRSRTSVSLFRINYQTQS